tara:strand:+ start:4781 stop:6259 length:1479 start_codon:yes stop_codon:yes gene_type:complete
LKNIIVLSRSSFLAKIQTQLAKEKIRKFSKGKVINKFSNSIGDEDKSHSAWHKHGFGIFTNSLSKELINKKVDVVVHSFKDLPVKNSRKTSFICLEREDPRDVVLIKQTSLKKKNLIIATSSPRRKYYLRLLKNYLPYQSFKSTTIRGNVQTRLKKILDSKKNDGVFMAKAAIDRIFKYGEKVGPKEFKKFKASFNKFEKIILPLSEFPSAAAQGCIALEYRKDDLQTQRILKKINHKSSLEDCSMERKYLAKWGGGCALDIGVTIENFLDKKILFAKGKDTHTKKYFKERKYLKRISLKKVKDIFPSQLSKYQMFKRELKDFSKKLDNKNILLTRGDFKETSSLKKASNLATSGTSTWKKINKKGILINSSLDGFGEKYRKIESYYKSRMTPTYKLSYEGNLFKSNYSNISHYKLVPSINEYTIDNLFSAKSFYWMSFSAFNLAIHLRPDILNQRNSCGPGQTYEQISKFIPKDKLNVYLNYQDFKKYELR